MLDRISRQLRAEGRVPDFRTGGEPSWLGITGSVESGTITYLGFFPGKRQPSVVVKIHRRPDSESRVASEWATLAYLAGLGGIEEKSFPEPVLRGQVGRHGFIATTVVTGVPFDDPWRKAAGRRHLRAMSEALGWLERAHRAEQRPRSGADAVSSARDVIRKAVEWFTMTKRETARAIAVAEDLHNVGGSRSWLCHGDFTRHNVLFAPHGKVGVIDWSDSRLDGLPLHDALFFLSTFLFQERVSDSNAELSRLFKYSLGGRSEFSRGARALLEAHARAVGIDADRIDPLIVAFLLERAVRERDRIMDSLEAGTVPRRLIASGAAEVGIERSMDQACLWINLFRSYCSWNEPR